MLISLNIFLSLAVSFTISYFLIPKIIKVSVVKKLFDVPNHRSATKHIVPTLGGIAIYAGFRTSQIVSLNNFNVDELKYMSLGVLAMFIVGLYDDIMGMPAKRKLLFQVVIALYLVMIGGYRITNLHGILGVQEVGYVIGSLLSVFIIVGIINALNLIDGIDGLASGVCILIATAYGFWFLHVGDYLYAVSCFCLIGSLIAFFLYNVFGKTNKIFMGDTGSLILGIVVALLTIHFNELDPVAGSKMHGLPAISLAIVIVPVIDTVRVFAIRLAHKKSPFTPDMNHIHHKVLKLTKSHLISSLLIISANALFILLAFGLIDIIGNRNLFILLTVLGLILADIPSLILNIKGSHKHQENTSILALLIFQKKSED